jgi:hypothetical protein
LQVTTCAPQNLQLYGPKGWLCGGETFVWGEGSICKDTVFPSSHEYPELNRVLEVTSGVHGGGCGQFYYTHNGNQLLNLAGYRYLRFELRSNVTTKIEYERGSTPRENGFKVATFIPSTNDIWTTIEIQLQPDAAPKLYSPLLVTILQGFQSVYIRNFVASQYAQS